MSVVTPTILSAGKPMDPSYELLSLDITKEVNRIPSAELMLIDGDLTEQTFPISDSSFFEPGKEIEIKLRYEPDGQDTTVFKGLVMRQHVAVDGHDSLLTIALKDAAIKMTLGRKSAVHRDQTDDKIMASLIGNSGLTEGTLATTQPEHAEIVQYYCTDWDFLLSRADAQGLLVVADDGEISAHEIAVSGSAKHSFEFGIDEIYNFEMEADASHQYANVESTGWDVKTQKLTPASKAKAFSLSQGNLKGDTLAKALGADTASLTNPISLDPKELQAWGDATMSRSRMSLIRGRLSVAGTGEIKPMDIMEVSGVGTRFDGKTLVTGVRHQVNQNGWQTEVQFGLSAQAFSSQEGIVDAPAAGLLPAVNGLQIGIIDTFMEDPDKHFRAKVILPGIDEKQGTVWARVAFPDAGKERGSFFWPEVGDEVVVGFFNDDPRQAVVLGSLYSAKNPPPKAFTLTAENIDKGIVTKKGTTIHLIDDEKAAVVIYTPGTNTILLDDDTQTIQIADQHGNALTLGKDGILIKSIKDVKIEAKGGLAIKTKEDTKMDVGGGLDIKTSKDTKVNASGKVEIKGSAVDVK